MGLRDERKNEPKIGETLYMYYNLRHRYKKATKISDKEKLKSKQHVELFIWNTLETFVMDVNIDGRLLTQEQVETLAINDGFDNAYQMAKWFYGNTKTRTITLTKKLYHWTDLKY